MKSFIQSSICLISILLLSINYSPVLAQDKPTKAKSESDSRTMKTYLIEREIPDIGQATKEDLKGISQKSCSVLDKMDGDRIKWVHSYVAEDKIYCIYKASSPELLREHAEQGGFPINSITVVSEVISPSTADN